MARQSLGIVTALVVSCASFSGCDSTAIDLPPCAEDHWVGAWAAAPGTAVTEYRDQSLRLVASPLRGGKTVRVVLSGRFSETPVRLQQVWLGKLDAGPAIKSGTNTRVTFSQQPDVTIPAGQDITSDPMDFEFAPFDRLAVSIDLSTSGGTLTEHSAAAQTSWLSARGASGVAADESGSAFTTTIRTRPLLMGLEVLARGTESVVVAIGDSITDGAESGLDKDERYPDFLARRINATDLPLSVINLGIGGNRVLRDEALPGAGQSLIKRLDADVLSRTDISNIIVLEGINDLGAPPQADSEELITGLTTVLTRLRERRVGLPPINVLVGTILPAGGTDGFIGALYGDTEQRRAEVNTFIRTTSLADGVIDFDQAIADPNDPTRIADKFDSGDGLHPGAAGYQKMADAVDLSLLAPRACR